MHWDWQHLLCYYTEEPTGRILMPHQPNQRLLSTPVNQGGQNYLNLTDLKVQTFSCLQHVTHYIMFMKYAGSSAEHDKYQIRWVWLFFNLNIWFIRLFAAVAAVHLSDRLSLSLLRTSAPMFSHSFCKSRQRLSFDPTVDLSNLFSSSA